MHLNTVIIIQARMGSTRLPGKVLKKINNYPILYYLLCRVQLSSIKNIFVATSKNIENDKIVEYVKKYFREIKIFRGSEKNVFSRYHKIANEFNFTTIVRVTADCPLIDFRIINKMIKIFENNKNLDYLSNTTPHDTRSYPDGMDVEVFSLNAINKANKLKLSDYDKEHVTTCFLNQNYNFKSRRIEYKSNLQKYKLSVDSQSDFNLISKIIKNVVIKNMKASMNDIIKFLKIIN